MSSDSSFQYNPSEIEPKWQKIWDKNKVYAAPSNLKDLQKKPKKYILDMFPYPSGTGLHVGHPKGYTATDVLSRMYRMQGFNILYAMGWDAFGLPAERAAEREGLHPADITKRNINNFKTELQRLGLSYDWDREINTSAPEYYKWTQWIWLQLFEKGLAYIEEVPVNWCPKLGTVVANEEVHEGKYIETGDPVERRSMKQWMLKITAYADRLLEDLDTLDWPESIKEMQRNWIGKSEGYYVTFNVADSDKSFSAFTTRVDTLLGVTFCVASAELDGILELATKEQKEEVEKYINKVKNTVSSEKTSHSLEKTGVFTGRYLINPISNERIPLWIADYVAAGYGTGFVMGVPGHDDRDHEFATKFSLPIKVVVKPTKGESKEQYFTDDGVSINSGEFSGLTSSEARKKIGDKLIAMKAGSPTIQYRLRDWLFSRQRFWGEPFPVMHLDDGTIMRVPDKDLPVLLPELVKEKTAMTDTAAPLSRASDDWLMVTLPDGRVGVRETNTMPQWAGSCWYYLRYVDPKNDKAAWDKELEKYWMPVDIYVGGVEHAVLHLLYSRFWHKVLYDCKIVTTIEPFQKLFNQGLLQAYSYRDNTGKYHYEKDIVEDSGKWKVKSTGDLVNRQVEKISKSKLNGIGLKDFIQDHGADTLRLFELFMGPVSQGCVWSSDSVEGVKRFLDRVWRIVVDEKTGKAKDVIKDIDPSDTLELQKELHKAIAQVTESIESIDKMNTAVSALMSLSHHLYKAETLPKSIVKDFLVLLSPMAPHIAEELWERIGNKGSITREQWPKADEKLLVKDSATIAVQINGKTRGTIEVPVSASNDDIEKVAKETKQLEKYLTGVQIKKVIHVKGRIANFIVG